MILDKYDILNMQIQKALFTPYIWGGSSPLNGVDCSGFVLELLKSVGLWPAALDTTAQGIYTYFKAKNLEASNQHFADLAFFGADDSSITHVGMIIYPGIMVEAGGGGSKTLTVEDARKAGACVRVRPLNFRKDFVCCLGVSDLIG